MTIRSSWVAIVSDQTGGLLTRTKWHALPLAARPATLRAGDRIAIVHAPRLRSAAMATVLGTAEVREIAQGEDLRIRHRIVAPPTHAPHVTDLRELLGSIGWTEQRLREKLGMIEPLASRTFDHIEDVLRDAAIAFGPAPKRKPHARPRTPGRRALVSARAAAGRTTR